MQHAFQAFIDPLTHQNPAALSRRVDLAENDQVANGHKLLFVLIRGSVAESLAGKDGVYW